MTSKLSSLHNVHKKLAFSLLNTFTVMDNKLLTKYSYSLSLSKYDVESEAHKCENDPSNGEEIKNYYHHPRKSTYYINRRTILRNSICTEKHPFPTFTLSRGVKLFVHAHTHTHTHLARHFHCFHSPHSRIL